MAGSRRQFSAEFKREAVQAAKRPGSSVARLAKEPELSDSVLRRWIRQLGSGRREAAPGKELKAAPTLCEGPGVKYGFMARHRAVWSIRMMCRMPGVSHGGFYDWCGRGPSKRSLAEVRHGWLDGPVRVDSPRTR